MKSPRLLLPERATTSVDCNQPGTPPQRGDLPGTLEDSVNKRSLDQLSTERLFENEV
jgi:hypothetical protein